MEAFPEWIQEWQEKAQGRRKAHRWTLAQLKLKKNKPITEMADEVHDEVFKKYDCLDCANCCTTVPPQLNRADIRRIARHLNLKPAAFKNHYTRIDEDGDTVINKTPCPFLNTDHTCQIYDVRPRACREYPHTHGSQFAQHLDLHLVNVRHCPAVFHILEKMNALLR